MTTDPIALPPPAFRLIWRDGQYRVSAPNIGDIDCYTAELARTHADNCIRALTEDVGKTQEALRSALGEIAELKASCVRELPSVDRGPWSADPENDYVTSADFGWDVSLRVDGDFLSAEERRTYVAWLTDTLNAAALARAEKAEARAGSVPADRVAMAKEAKRLVAAACGTWRVARGDNTLGAEDVQRRAEAVIDALASAGTPPDEATSRAQFEAWARKRGYYTKRAAGKRMESQPQLDYEREDTDDAWTGWRAARTQGDAA